MSEQKRGKNAKAIRGFQLSSRFSRPSSLVRAERSSIALFGTAGNFVKLSDYVRFCKTDFSHVLAIGGKERRVRFGTGAII